MRKFDFRLVFVLMMAATILSCSGSDSDTIDPCASVSCLNDGVCVDGTCDCPENYTGTNCATPKTPTKIKITKIRVTHFNNEDGANAWDNASGADVFVQIVNASGNSVYVSDTYYPDVFSTGSNFFDFTPAAPIEIIQVSAQHTIYLGDLDVNDTPPNPNDQMGMITFPLFQSINGFPATLMLSDNAATPFRVQLSLTYEW